MKGSHNIVVETERMKYEFTIRRNITVILGDSATGKTTLVEFLNMYSQRGHGSGVSVSSDVPCIVFTAMQGLWQTALKEIRHSIVFIDEGQSFIFSKEFAELVQASDNYYVLISRRPLHNIPYSTKEIYGIRTSGKYHFPEKVYQEFYPIYEDDAMPTDNAGTILLVEDSGAGFEFFQKNLPHVKCISAEGNSKISAAVENLHSTGRLLVLADGAAFGAYIESLTSLREIYGDVGIYLPESFEWLILSSGVTNDAEIPEILEHPEDYIDSSVYFSWERFFTDLLETKTADNTLMKYNKSKLNDYYISDNILRRVLNVMPNEVVSAITERA